MVVSVDGLEEFKVLFVGAAVRGLLLYELQPEWTICLLRLIFATVLIDCRVAI